MKSMGFYRLTNLVSLLFLGLAFLLYYMYPPAISSCEDCPKSIYEFTAKDIHGNDVPLSNYKGKVLLIVNVASKCNKVGYSYAFGLMNGPSVTFFHSAKSALQQRPIDFRLQIRGICQHYYSSNAGLTQSNYRELNILYDKYKHQGFEILAFPCNQFAWQEPGTSEEIQEAVCTRFKAEFPIFEKIDVNGKNAAPLYKFLKLQKGGLLVDTIKWNFTKFLVNKEGKVVQRYAPTTPPLEIENDIQNLLD